MSTNVLLSPFIFASLGRLQTLDWRSVLELSTVKSPAVAIKVVKVPDPAQRVITSDLIERASDQELVKRAAHRFTELVGHILGIQSHQEIVA